MVSSHYTTAALRTDGAKLTLPDTGSEKLCTLSFPLFYTGPEPSRMLTFAAQSAGEAVELKLTWDGAEREPLKVVAKLRGAQLELGEDKAPRVKLSFLVARQDTREPRDVLSFLLDAAHAEALELDAELRIVQPPLPFPKPGEGVGDPDEDDQDAPGQRFLDEVGKLEEQGVTVSMGVGGEPLRPVKGRRRPKGSSKPPKA